ncbi:MULTISPECIES: sulfatase-like hydrolase/transferase [unclassified Ruegeria]|uniref:sulfatase-like hydrolase/transferase n=1 Tax=unclassified Ruegeria TaxID=2625375 RepID=UPI001489AE12|nr:MULTISPECIES: sulfatase-like hydrolase/transferase [unclassified Ruegeria]NOD95411.1 sulfatase-like hydrolase/transferase [Ruegeria sp. HKCCD4884]
MTNFLVIMSDEHQARAMGCAEHPFVQTPNLDALAARGTRFSNAYTPCPICVPARASFATGQPVHVTRLWDNAMPYTGQIKGWGHALQRGGIPVESIGKLHYRAPEDPAGFDTEHLPMMVADGVGMVWASIRREDERVSVKPRMLGEYIGPGQSKYTEYDAAVTKRTEEWLLNRAEEDDDQPWCLYVGLVAPHFPLVCPQEFFEMYPSDILPPAKLHPNQGHVRHPWVEKQNAMMDSENRFDSEEERLAAMSAYFGLTSWLDSNVGRILNVLQASGMADDTVVVYTSDHGDNVGARGLWGKSNLYEESVAIPMIMAGPNVPIGICETPVSLLDLSATIPAHFCLDFACAGQSLFEIAAAPPHLHRAILSQYHAAGAVSGAFMLRQGGWKLNQYIGFEPELFDLLEDPEELTNLAPDPRYKDKLLRMQEAMSHHVDIEAVDALAFNDQADLIAQYGGREAALKLGAPGATPPPGVT